VAAPRPTPSFPFPFPSSARYNDGVPFARPAPRAVPMSRLALLLPLLASLTVLAPASAAEPSKQEELDRSLRQLEKDIAAVRGLEFKAPVKAKIIPRPAEGARGVQGYYSLADKTLFIYDDVKGNYERGVLVHEMVHALQDQHFGLEKLHPTDFDGDADLARAALIEGDATFTMIELLKKDQPRVAAMLDGPLEKSNNLRNAFLYAQGARYVRSLKERGGWEAVNAAYRFPPSATARILHPDVRFTAINLGPGKVRGELGLIGVLASRPETRPLAAEAAAGWRGDRYVEEDGARAWELAFAGPEQAERCRDALARLAEAEKNTDVEVVRRGEHVYRYEAPEAARRALRDRFEGPPRLTVYTRDKKTLSFGELTDRLLDADIICVGESHDSEPNHRVQREIIAALYARDDRLGVGMEMFQRPFQKEIDRYFRGEGSEEEFLKATEWRQRWGYEWSMYRPVVEFCRRNGVPLAALNARRELTGRVSAVGHAGLTDEEKKELGTIDFNVKEHRDYWYDRLAKMHGDANVPAERKERSYQVMTVWDEYMADSAARFQTERGLRRMVVLAGSGHIERGFGIPARAAKRTGGKAVTVRIEVGGDPDKLLAEPTTDYLIVVR
jgi:uncharacterized iron-regulated protein